MEASLMYDTALAFLSAFQLAWGRLISRTTQWQGRENPSDWQTPRIPGKWHCDPKGTAEETVRCTSSNPEVIARVVHAVSRQTHWPNPAILPAFPQDLDPCSQAESCQGVGSLAHRNLQALLHCRIISQTSRCPPQWGIPGSPAHLFHLVPHN